MLHHAYIIKGEKGEVLPVLCALLEEHLGFSTKGNPDFWCGEFETFGIDDSRDFKALQARKPVTGDKNIFVLATNFFTHEAQSALLKVFEDPADDTHVFIITPNADMLLPTLLSRLYSIPSPYYAFGKEGDLPAQVGGEEQLVKKFLGASKSERLELVKYIIEEKDKARAIAFVNSLEAILHKKGNIVANAHILERILQYRKYMQGNAPSLKMILEHLALIAPTE